MATIQVTVSPEELLQIVDQMPPDELADFTAKVLAVKARRTAATLNKAEETLLQQIYAAQLPPEQQTRLHQLGQQLEEDGHLPAAEQQELHTLTEQSEAKNAVRIEKAAELATLWQQPLSNVMKQLGLWRSNGQ